MTEGYAGGSEGAALNALLPQGLLLLGCGRMGQAMLAGWLEAGLAPEAVTVIDPHPSDWLAAQVTAGVRLNETPEVPPSAFVIAVKPQMMQEALAPWARFGDGDTTFLSIAAGTTLAGLEAILGANSRIIRAMPNTPAAIGRGISAIVGNDRASEGDLTLAERLLAAVGQVVRLADEGLMDAVTAVSGSGPAYVFLLIETLAAAGERAGLPADLALVLARETVAGAGELARRSGEDPAILRQNVTSPGGTTAAALEVLMDPERGFGPLMEAAVARAAARGRELAGAVRGGEAAQTEEREGKR